MAQQKLIRKKSLNLKSSESKNLDEETAGAKSPKSNVSRKGSQDEVTSLKAV